MFHHFYCPEAAADSGEQLWAEHDHHFDDDERDYVLVTVDLACANLTIVDHDAYYTHRGDDPITLGERHHDETTAMTRSTGWAASQLVEKGDATAAVVFRRGGRALGRVIGDALTWLDAAWVGAVSLSP